FGVVERGPHRIARGRVLVQHLQIQLIRPPVLVRSAAVSLGREWALLFVVHVVVDLFFDEMQPGSQAGEWLLRFFEGDFTTFFRAVRRARARGEEERDDARESARQSGQRPQYATSASSIS